MNEFFLGDDGEVYFIDNEVLFIVFYRIEWNMRYVLKFIYEIFFEMLKYFFWRVVFFVYFMC